MTRARIALKQKFREAQIGVQDQRVLADTNRKRRSKKVQDKWNKSKDQIGNVTSIIHAEDPNWEGPTSLYAATTQFLELGLDQQVLHC